MVTGLVVGRTAGTWPTSHTSTMGGVLRPTQLLKILNYGSGRASWLHFEVYESALNMRLDHRSYPETIYGTANDGAAAAAAAAAATTLSELVLAAKATACGGQLVSILPFCRCYPQH